MAGVHFLLCFSSFQNRHKKVLFRFSSFYPKNPQAPCLEWAGLLFCLSPPKKVITSGERRGNARKKVCHPCNSNMLFLTTATKPFIKETDIRTSKKREVCIENSIPRFREREEEGGEGGGWRQKGGRRRHTISPPHAKKRYKTFEATHQPFSPKNRKVSPSYENRVKSLVARLGQRKG